MICSFLKLAHTVFSDELSPSKSNAYTGIPSKVYFEKVKIFPDGDEVLFTMLY